MTRTLAPQAVDYLYRPADDQVSPDTSAGRLQQLVVTGTAPFAVVADSVKYEAGRGQALSYPLQPGSSPGDVLALPLVQKGSASSTGSQLSGDTSGLRLFNASPTDPAIIAYEFRLVDGTFVPLGQQSPSLATIPPMGTLLLYTPSLPELPDGFRGAFLAEVRSGGPLSVVSNIVNYDIAGDGSLAYSALSVPAHQPGQGGFLALPEAASNPVTFEIGDDQTVVNGHTVAVVVVDRYGQPGSGVRVCVDIVDGPNRGASDEATRRNCGNADQTGQFLFRYRSNGTLGTDSIRVWVDLNQDGVTDTNEIATVHKTWVRGLSRELSLQQQTCQPELSNRSQGRCVNLIGTTHRLTVRFIDGTGLPIPGVLVRAATDRGGTLEPTLSCSATGRDGRADCSYTRTTPGTDRIVIWADLDRDGERGGDEPWLATTKSWVQPQLFLTPDCEAVGQNTVPGQEMLLCDAAPRSELQIAVRVTGPGGSPGVSGVLVRGRIVSGVNDETPDLACTATGADGRATCTLRDQRANFDNFGDQVRIWADLNADGVADPWEPQQRFFVAWQFEFQVTVTHRDVVPIYTFDEAFVNLRNEDVTITATVTSKYGTPVPGVPVFFTVEGGPNAGLRDECGRTDQHGQARCTYHSEKFGVDWVFVVFDLDASGHRSLADADLLRYLAWSADLTINVQCPGGILYDGVCHAATGGVVTVSMKLVDGAGPVEGVLMYCSGPYWPTPVPPIPPDLPQVPPEENSSACTWNPANIRTSSDGTTVVTVSSQSDGVYPHLIWADLVEDGQLEAWEPRQWFAMAYCPALPAGQQCTFSLRAAAHWSAASDSAALSGIGVPAAALVPSSSNETQRPRTRRGG
ncbi:Ig-like domain-containing protein [Thermomicrobiaceae bacterium CFH 74404]|uniref:Ig-like domain-containing protein n=1 Tax=Thermalbibacter longus TaxID=2951981 RepID=A0AA41WD32_9BACT|nr:Ig-like domain-containing protein [Thermalbibacter longus]MCM8750672.1 Ig-like domain-containing protein [Thermalbibacter longus]